MADLTKVIGDTKPAEKTAKFRRIITGHDADNKAIFIEDEICPNRFAMGGCETFVINEMWRMVETPGNNDEAKPDDPAANIFDLNPTENGNVFRIIEFPPDVELGVREDGTPVPPTMHRTASIDYAYIIKGEVYAVLDDGVETLMKEGDVLIQRGTNHCWSNRSDEPCFILFVLCGAKPMEGLTYK